MSALQELRERLTVLANPSAALAESDETWIYLPEIDNELLGRAILELHDKVRPYIFDREHD